MIGAFFPEYAIYFILVPIIVLVGLTVVYSYIEYQKEIKENGQE